MIIDESIWLSLERIVRPLGDLIGRSSSLAMPVICTRGTVTTLDQTG